MLRLKPLHWLLAFAALFATWTAQATVIFTTSYALTNADPSQLGRLSRSGVPQDWSMSLAFPGEINPGVSYHYQTFTLDLDGLMTGFTFGQYLQVTVDYGAGTSDFVAAYLDSYNPGAKSTGWLGDTGSSGNQFGNPAYFQTIAGSGHDLVLLLNDTDGAINATNAAVTIMVEAFTDTMYTDLAALPPPGRLPEPASLALAAVAFVALAGARRRSKAS